MTVGEGVAVGFELEEGPLTEESLGGETEGAREGTEVNIPVGLIRVGVEVTLSSGTMEDGSTERVGNKGTPETGDLVGRLPAGSVGDKKTVEVRVIVTGPPAAGSVACGIPSDVEEGGLIPPPPVDSAGLGVPATESSIEDVEEGSTETVEEGSIDGVEDGPRGKVIEDGSAGVAGGSTAVGSSGPPLERVTLGPSNSASLRVTSGCLLPMA